MQEAKKCFLAGFAVARGSVIQDAVRRFGQLIGQVMFPNTPPSKCANACARRPSVAKASVRLKRLQQKSASAPRNWNSWPPSFRGAEESRT